MKYSFENGLVEVNELERGTTTVDVKWYERKVMKTEMGDSCSNNNNNRQLGSRNGGHHHRGEARRKREPKDKVEQLCRVCAEQAAGYHYGVFTCEGCKSFFGRYQKGKRKPPQECMGGQGQCDIRSRARNRCRYCRYQRCLSAGMSKSASRYGRRSNWFKVHCLSEAQDEEEADDNDDTIEDVKRGPSDRPAAIDRDHSPLLVKSAHCDWRHSPPVKRTPPTVAVANPKPIYPTAVAVADPHNLFAPAGVIQPNPLHLPLVATKGTMTTTAMTGNKESPQYTISFPGSTIPNASLHLPILPPPTPTSAAAAIYTTPLFEYFSLPSVVRIIGNAHHHPAAFLVDPGPLEFFGGPPRILPEPAQNEPLDLSLKRAPPKTTTSS